MKKYIYLIAISILIASCKKPKDPEPIITESQGGYNDIPTPEKPTVQLKQLIARNVQMGVMVDQFLSFTYNTDGFVETVLVEINKQTGEKISKTLNTLTYENKTKLSGAKYMSVLFNSDPSKNDTTWVTTSIIYEVDKITIKKNTIIAHHQTDIITTTYEDQEKDFIYIQLDGENRIIKLWTSQGQSQTFEYDEKGNYIKTGILSGKNPIYYLSHKYDNDKNPFKEIISFGFFDRVVQTGFNPTLFYSKNNPTSVNVSDSNPTGFVYQYEYNGEGYPTKRTPVNANDPTTLEYIY